MDAANLEQVQSFRAATMRDALDAVRQSLGDNAVILETRSVAADPYTGAVSGDEVEVLAGLERQAATSSMDSASANAAPALRRQARDAGAGTFEPPDHAVPGYIVDSEDGPLAPTTDQTVSRLGGRHEDRQNDAVDEVALDRGLANRITPSRHPVDLDLNETPLSARLDAIEEALRSLSRDRRGHGPVIDRLCDRGVPVGLARFIVTEAVGDDPSTPPSQSALVTALASLMKTVEPPRVRPGEQRRIALIGPTGVGKTTTLAKIAAGYRLHDNLNVGLITVDDYRVAAADQLRTYADLLQCPLRIVTDDDEMLRAINDLSRCDVLLVDTAGFGKPDHELMRQLAVRLEKAAITDRYFVVSAVSSLASTRLAAKRYRELKPTAAICSKLDETPEPGILAAIATEIPLPLTYVTTGQEVPKDIEVADAVWLAQRVFADDHEPA